jgi:DNA invertase Pin-like site-specific DNA recombinase
MSREGLEMKKAGESAEKTANLTTLEMIGLTRSSSQEVADGYGPSIQKSELVADARSQVYRLGCIRDIVEPAPIDLEERELFNEVMAEAIALRKANKCDGLSFSRCDRLSRRFDAALQIALDCKKHGLTLRFVRENQWLRPDDEPMQFVLFVLQAFGVHTQTGISMANMNAGRRRAAAEGKLPAGVGIGMLGYTLANKKFTTNSFTVIVDEILERALQGDSINRITRELQARDVRTPAGKVITRSSVSRILRNSRRYAGIWDWGGYQIKGLIPPRISEDQAERILANLKRNRENSHGFGKRKWLTSRVICGICGHRYNLRVVRGCGCLYSDPMRALPQCPNVTIPWKRLSNTVWDTFVQCITGLDALELAVKDKRQTWKAQKARIERQVSGLKEQINRLEQKRRQYSWQQAEGIITGEELRTAHKQIKSEENIINEQLGRIEQFRGEPAPPDMATFKKLAEYWTGAIASELDHASDDVRARFAEFFDLHATILPDSSLNGYHIDLTANIPLEMEGEKPGAYDMVFSPSGRTTWQSPIIEKPTRSEIATGTSCPRNDRGLNCFASLAMTDCLVLEFFPEYRIFF